MTIETAGSVHIFVFLFSEFVLPKLNLQARPIICNVTLTTDCNLIFTSNVLYATSAVFVRRWMPAIDQHRSQHAMMQLHTAT